MATMMKIDAGEVTQAKDVFYVTPSEVHADPVDNPRNKVSASGLEAPFDPDALDRLEADILANGQRVPCLVERDLTTHRLSMVDGWTRHAIVSKLAQTDPNRKLLVRVVAGLDAEGTYVLSVKSNCLRGGYATSAKAAAAAHLRDVYGYDDTKIADVVGCSTTHVANFWVLLGAPAPLKAAVADGTMTAAAVIDVARAGLTDEQVGDLTSRVKAAKAKADAANGGKGKGGKTKPVKQAKVNEVLRDVKGKAAEKAEANGTPAPSGTATKSKRTARHLAKALEGRKTKSFPISTVVLRFLEGDWTDENAANKLTDILDKYELARDPEEVDAD